MARETKEQRELRRIEEARLEEAAKLAFKASLPARLMQLQAVSPAAGVNTRVSLTASGPCIEFTCQEYNNEGFYFKEELSYESEEWQVEYVERRLREFKEEIDARDARRALAESTWNSLPAADRQAIKEFIHCLQ